MTDSSNSSDDYQPIPEYSSNSNSSDDYQPIPVDAFDEQFYHYWESLNPRNDSCSEIIGNVFDILKRRFIINQGKTIYIHYTYPGYEFSGNPLFPIPIDLFNHDRLYRCTIENYHNFLFIYNRLGYISIYQSLETIPGYPGYSKRVSHMEYGKFISVLYGLIAPDPGIHSNAYRILTGYPYPNELKSIYSKNKQTGVVKPIHNHPSIVITEINLIPFAQKRKSKKKPRKSKKKPRKSKKK